MDTIHDPDLNDNYNLKTLQYGRLKYTAIKITTRYVKITIIYCSTSEEVADILDFTHNAMPKIVVYNTTMSGIPENIMVTPKS